MSLELLNHATDIKYNGCVCTEESSQDVRGRLFKNAVVLL